MKNIKFLLTLIVFAFLPNHAVYSKDIYPLVNKMATKPIRIYVFANYGACHTCIDNLYYFNTLNHSYNDLIETVVFLSGISIDAVDDFKKSNGFDVTVIPDVINAYAKSYDVTKGNYVVILDREGRLIQRGETAQILGNIDIEATINKLGLSEQKTFKKQKSLKIIEDGGTIHSSRYQYGTFSKYFNKYYIIDQIINSLLIVDSTGLVEKRLVIPYVDRFSTFVFQKLQWHKKDSTLLIHLNGEFNDSRTWGHSFVTYNIHTSEFSELPIPYISKYNRHLNLFPIESNNSYLVIANGYQVDAPIKPKQLLTLLDKSGTKIKEFEKFSDVFEKYNLNEGYMQSAYVYNNKIFSWQAYTDSINIYNFEGDFEKRIQIEHSNSYRLPSKRINPTSDIDKFWIDFSKELSYIRGFQIDESNGNIMTLYRNSYIPDHVTDIKSPEIEDKYYINIYTNEGKLIHGDIKVNADFPHILSFENGVVAILHSSNNIMQVDWYEVKK